MSIFKSQNIIACSHCDLLVSVNELNNGETAECPRCGGEIASHISDPRDIFILSITGLILFFSTLTIPALKFKMGNLDGEFSILETPFAMFNNEQSIIGFIIFFSIISTPLTYFFSILWLVSPIYLLNKKPRYSRLFIKLMNISKDWIMLEVFFVSLLVAMIKLSDNMSLDINLAFITMFSLIVISAVLHKLFDANIYFEWIKNLQNERTK